MLDALSKFFAHLAWVWSRRLLALVDGSAILLILPALWWMWQRDQPLVRSIGEWTVLFVILAGVSIVVSRITFPHLNLELFLKKALNGSVACSIVVCGLLLFVAWTMQTVASWARPIGTITGG